MMLSTPQFFRKKVKLNSGDYYMRLEREIKEALKQAEELKYDEKCKERLKEAKTSIEVGNIMTSARRRVEDK